MKLVCAQRVLDLSSPAVMGVLNVTPDSFSDGGRYQRADAALAHARQMAGEGAAIIDVGGESTRPGSRTPSLQEELDRVVGVVERVARECDVVVSVDTSQPEVMRAAVAAGAGLINDVRALQRPGAVAAAAASGAAICLMHMQGEPGSMQQQPHYVDVVTEVKAFLAQRLQTCRAAGVAAGRLCLDPGFGFGKSAAHNLTLLRELATLAPADCPLLVGLSRKSLLQALTGRPVEQRLAGSVALATIAVLNGARIVRAHDVGATRDALQVAAALRAAAAGT
ncbi:MAG: dihydropteroate synthase [Steroidobacteraceae bacterium]